MTEKKGLERMSRNKEIAELGEKILSALKAGQDIIEVVDLIEAPDEMFYEALLGLVEKTQCALSKMQQSDVIESFRIGLELIG